MFICSNQEQEIHQLLDMCYQIHSQYCWLSDTYVSDFYLHNHWSKLPRCWRDSLSNLEPKAMANIINPSASISNFQILPLSLLSLRQAMKFLSIQRKQQLIDISSVEYHPMYEKLFSNKQFSRTFWKHVKDKKKHEIEIMAKKCYLLGKQMGCNCIVDVGAGMGHLSRMLSYGYGFKVFCIEAKEYLTKQASKLDEDIERMIAKLFPHILNKIIKPTHINVEIKTISEGVDILEAIKGISDDEINNFQFGIVGLHPCGNLGPTLLKFFNNCIQVKFISIVGCCYMKLSPIGYPLSRFSKTKCYNLSYCVQELACHGLELYIQKLNSNQIHKLKIHALRAALEKFIIEIRPDLRCCRLKSVNYDHDITFYQYCTKSFPTVTLEINKTVLEEIENDLNDWKKIAIFHSLRLLLAPLIETIITLDRLLFILESGKQGEIIIAFNPDISPRNQVLTAIK